MNLDLETEITLMRNNDEVIKDIVIKLTKNDKIKIWKANNKEKCLQHSRDLYNRRKGNPDFLAYKNEVQKRVIMRKKLALESEK